MDALLIEGGIPLQGTINVSGAKNAALPLLFSSILLDEPVRFNNVPKLRDINTTLKLLSVLGCAAEFQHDTVHIQPCTLNPIAPYDLVKTMRASILCLGPLLARTGQAQVALPGGCAIGARPVDQHLKGLEKMGAKFTLKDGYVIGKCKKLKGAHITFDMPTVGGTENLLMAASMAEGTTILENVAHEPEIVDLANFLIKCGAKIKGQGTRIITIEGVSSLKGCDYSVMPDRIEAGTFLIAAAITGGKLLVKNCPWEELEAVILKLKSMNIQIEPHADGAMVSRDKDAIIKCTDINTQPFPGFPTDMQAQIMALLCLANGSSLIEESIFENRFMHVSELMRMGADIKISGRSALIRGVKKLRAAPVMASDLRASASLVLAGLVAQGQTKIQRIYHLDRGYEKIEDKLTAVGARIFRRKE